MTINTILTDDEILKAKELIENLSAIGVDAIIVQDMGLLEPSPLAGEGRVRGIPIFASTQCDNRTPEKVKFLESVGFSRVILARELSIDQIKEIKKHTNVELETFIHGALCVSYSGQCYLSQMIGGRSANRGECAQPCRKKYSLVDEDGNFMAKDKYLLNLKDFNASKYLKELAEAGVTSFKIEGRLKDENYVKNIVGYYRKLIDELQLGKTSSGEIMFDFEPKLEKSFNRGFTDYFIKKRNECYSFLSPKSIGEHIGKVTKVGQDFFELSLPSPLTLHSQDGLCFFVKEELSGCLVNKCESRSGIPARQQRIYPNKMDGIKVGTEIYRNVDSEFEKTLKNSKTCRKIEVNINFDLGKIYATDKDNNSVEIDYKFEELAQNEEKMIENIQNQLKKSGESDFLIKNVQISTDKIPFLPVSKINELRRELIRNLEKEREVKSKKQKAKSDEPTFYPLPFAFCSEKIDYRANILNKYAKEFYENHGCKVTEMALESGIRKSDKCVMTTKHCLRYAFNMCNAEDAKKQLYLIDEKGKKYPLEFDCKNCQMEIYFK